MGSDATFCTDQRVIARGRTWCVIRTDAFTDCMAVSLRECGGNGAPMTRTLLAPFDRLRPVTPANGLHVVRPRRWLHALRRAACDLRPFGGLTTLVTSSVDLLPYQLEPALAVLRDGTARILIADAVGLGKTIQAGVVLAELHARDEQMRALVLTPAGLRAQWSHELKTHFAIDAATADSAWLLRRARDLPPDINPWLLPGVYIASFDFLKRPEVLAAIEELTWDAVVVDEAHNATRGSARLCAIDAVAARARTVLLLTATPHSGSSADFASLCGIGTVDAHRDPILLFQRGREHVAARRRRTSVLGVRPAPAERRMHRLLEAYSREVCREARHRGDLQARLAVIVLRKRALSSAGSLAISARRRLDLLSGRNTDASEQLMLPLAGEDPLDDAVPDAILGSPGLADSDRERRLLEQVLQAAAEAARAESKIVRLRRLLARVREPVIVFTEYRDTLARLWQAVLARGVPPSMLHGGQAAAEREAVQDQFNREGGVLLATDAAAEGLNLQQGCRFVVHFELPWSPGRLEQRAGRVDRIGQQRTVHELALVAADTAERLVLLPLLRRLERMRRDLPGSHHALQYLSEASVAAAVLGEPVGEGGDSCAAQACHVGPSPALAVLAAAEAARVHRLRGWIAASGHTPRRTDRPVPVSRVLQGKSGLPEGVLAVYALTLNTAAGRVAHSELACVHLSDRVGDERRADDVRQRAAEAVRLYADPLTHRIAVAAVDRFEEVATAHAQRAARLAARERTLLEPLASASARLVQAGLFDSRALREQLRQAIARAGRVSGSTRRVQVLSDSTLVRSIELVAVLVIGHCPRR